MGSEHRATDAADHQKLVQALQTVIGVAMGQRLDSMRQATKNTEEKLSNQIESTKKGAMDSIDSLLNMVQELETKLSTRIESVKKETAESLESMRRELEIKVTESITVATKEATETMDKVQHNVMTQSAEMIGRLSRVEESQDRVVNDLEGHTPDEIEKQLQVRVLAVKNELEQSLTSVHRELATLRSDLKQQVQATERVSAFLNSMASVFSVSPPKEADGKTVVKPGVRQMVLEGPEPVAFEQGPKLTREEVDNAVERALGEEWSPGKTVEMRNPLFRGKGK
jgi:hypothetical protein